MKVEDFLPTVMAVASGGAGVIYLAVDRPVTALYWIASAVLLFSVILQSKGFR